MVYDSAANTDRFDVGLFIVGSMVVTVAFLVAAAVSERVAIGAALASTGSIVASWMGMRLIDAQPAAGSGFGDGVPLPARGDPGELPVQAEQAFDSATMVVPGGGQTAADAIVERRRSRKVRAP